MHSTFLRVGDQFPDAELLDQEGRPRTISSFLTPSRIDSRVASFDPARGIGVITPIGPVATRVVAVG